MHKICIRQKRYSLNAFPNREIAPWDFSSRALPRGNRSRGPPARDISPDDHRPFLSRIIYSYGERRPNITCVQIIIARYRPLVTLTKSLGLMAWNGSIRRPDTARLSRSAMCDRRITNNQNLIFWVTNDSYVTVTVKMLYCGYTFWNKLRGKYLVTYDYIVI